MGDTVMQYYILKKEQVATGPDKPIFARTKPEHRQVLEGSLWYRKSSQGGRGASHVEADDARDPKAKPIIVLYSEEYPGLSILCQSSDLNLISDEEYNLLISLNSCKERNQLYNNKKILGDVLKIDKDCIVYFNNDYIKDLPSKTPVIVRYKGPLPDQKGTRFGVELSECHHGKGTTDGEYRKERFFTCPPDCGLFLPVSKLEYGCDRSEFTTSSEVKVADYSVSHGSPDLHLGERVVWLSDSGHEAGVVKWLGVLPGSKNKELTVGVEFDNAVGSGKGKYKNKQLFQAKQNHASLIPVMGLIKESELYQSGPSTDTEYKIRTPDTTDNLPSCDAKERPKENVHGVTDGATTKSTVKRIPRRCPDTAYSSQIVDNQLLHGSGKPGDISTGYVDMFPAKLPGKKLQERSIYDTPNEHVYENMTDGLDHGYDKITYSVLSGTGLKKGAATHPISTVSSINKPYHTVGRSPYSTGIATPATTCAGVDPVTKKSYSAIVKTIPIYKASETVSNTLIDFDTSPSPTRREPEAKTSAMPKVSHVDKKTTHTVGTRTKTKYSCQRSIPSEEERKTNIADNSKSETASADHTKPITLDTRDLDIDIDIGSMVEVIGNPPECRYGVVRWIGYLRDKNKPFAGLEMDEESSACTDGTFGQSRVFICPPKKGFFVFLTKLKKDSRFVENSLIADRRASQAFGSLPCDDIADLTDVPTVVRDATPYVGKNKGIQGHHNSCYLDATLFSMFAFTTVFDSILHRPKLSKDIQHYDEVQQVLREGVVNNLRRNFYVRADKVLKLRTLLDRLSSVQGLMTDEKDPEEFLNCLLDQTLKAEPFIKLSSGQESYLYQLFMEKDEKIILPTTQQLLGLSFMQSDIKLAEVPSCFIIQMPRFGKDFKMYKRIVPSQYLDITDILEYAPRECTICGGLAEVECKECYQHFGDEMKIEFCRNCLKISHTHPKRLGHRTKQLKISEDYLRYRRETGKKEIQRELLELFAVICIETSHYVAFVKCGTGIDAPWIFFDSMADRIGEQHGYNIPEVTKCNFLPGFWQEQKTMFAAPEVSDRQLPEQMRRLLCDSYICMYQSPLLTMYK